MDAEKIIAEVDKVIAEVTNGKVTFDKVTVQSLFIAQTMTQNQVQIGLLDDKVFVYNPKRNANI